MASEGPCRFGMVAEDASDARRGRTLVDRAIRESEELRAMLEGLPLDDFRCWQGLQEASDFLDIHDVPTSAREQGLRVHGWFSGEKAAKDARLVRETLLLFKRCCSEIDAVVILRDTDEKPEETHKGIEQARKTEMPFVVVVGMPCEAMEAWLLAGCIPDSDLHTVLEKARRDYGFWPQQEPHLLSHKENVPKSGKELVERLAEESREPFEERCLNAPLDTLRRNGEAAGLARFLDEVEERLVPLIGASTS